MEVSYFTLSLLAAFVPLLIIAVPIDESTANDKEKRSFNGKPKMFSGALPKQMDMQTWNDWFAKRNFGQKPFGYAKLQNWKDWAVKRGMIMSRNSPRFGAEFGKNPALQNWENVWQKRGLSENQKDVLEGPGLMNKFHFQNWNNWMSKRGMGSLGNEQVGPNSFRDFYTGKLQSWDEFAKKSDFGKQHDMLGMDGLQPWHAYSKRFDGADSPFNSFDPHKNLMKWDDIFKREATQKRQLGAGSKSFGKYGNYFTNGLQDWRNTFQKPKRSTSNANIANDESN